MHVLCYMNMLAEINYGHCRSLPLIFAKCSSQAMRIMLQASKDTVLWNPAPWKLHHNTRFTTTVFLYYSQVVILRTPSPFLVITPLPLQVRNTATKRCIQLVWLGLMSVHPSLVSTGDELRISIITTRPWDQGYAHPVCNYSTAIHERSLSLSVAGEI